MRLMCMKRRRFYQTNCFLSLTECHGVPCYLPSRITTKVLKTARLFLQDQDQMFKTKAFIFVLEAPRDHDPGLEDYITE